jgi:uncharacterized protein
MAAPEYAKAHAYVLHRLQTELPGDLYYHGIHHTLDDVLPAAVNLSELEGLSDEDRLLVRTAALYHDIGYIEAYERNEPIAVRIAEETLPGFGYTDEQIAIIGGVIMATQLPQEPQNLMQQIICDADLNSLGRDDFFITAHRLRLELVRRGQIIGVREWYQRQIEFLQAHHYWTTSAHALFDAGKVRTMHELRSVLGI